MMNEVVDRILQTYQLMRNVDPEQIPNSRQKITLYVEKLNSAGEFNQHQLAMYGLAYLNELHDGPDPRFTGGHADPIDPLSWIVQIHLIAFLLLKRFQAIVT